MFKDLTKAELEARMSKFCSIMDQNHPDWDTAFILSKVNQYYFMGTMQDGMLILKRNGKNAYFVRRSFERAKDESPLDCVYPMNSYRDAVSIAGPECGNLYLESEIVTIGILERLKRHFSFKKLDSLDREVQAARAVKTSYELNWMERAGKRHLDFLQNMVPPLLREGISEADLSAELYESMVKHGHQGICRLSMFESEMALGEIGFGESSLYPTNFDGPGGAYGMGAAVPLVGSRERKLKKGDLVFVDVGYGLNGYHTDKTQIYQFGGKPDAETLKIHRKCMAVQTLLADNLKPGAIPSGIYQTVTDALSDDFKENFMGFGSRWVKFYGHGIGLQVDEFPVIAAGFDMPLDQNMVIALEPKKGVPGIGMVGVEDTYIVTPDGGRCITGGGADIMVV